MKKSKKSYIKVDEKAITTNRSHEIHFGTYYPKKNPANWLNDITSTLEYVGVFDGLDESGSGSNAENFVEVF